jgi:glycosyltransferase involved in cell wall biosynthesis
MDIVSILIPVYNRVHLISETVESALFQTYTNLEIIICDNCSTDGTWELIQKLGKKDHRILIFQNKENIGPVKNWKKCVEHANGNYSKILFSDDLISENYISECIHLMNNKTAFVLSNVHLIKDGKVVKQGYKYGENPVYNTDYYFKNILLENNEGFPISPGAAFFRTSELLSSIHSDIKNPLGLGFSKFGAGNDLLIFLLIANKYSQLQVAQGAIAFFRIHDNSFTIANDLTVYYNLVKLNFLSKHKKELLRKFTAFIKFRSIVDKKQSELVPYLEHGSDYLFMIKMLINKIEARLSSNKQSL